MPMVQRKQFQFLVYSLQTSLGTMPCPVESTQIAGPLRYLHPQDIHAQKFHLIVGNCTYAIQLCHCLGEAHLLIIDKGFVIGSLSPSVGIVGT
jgi:hypothetical protein